MTKAKYRLSVVLREQDDGWWKELNSMSPKDARKEATRAVRGSLIDGGFEEAEISVSILSVTQGAK